MKSRSRQPSADDHSAGVTVAEARAHLRRCATDAGFVAACDVEGTARQNYARVWARDAVICGIAALLDGDAELVGAFERTLATLAAAQGPSGQAPSNVAPGGAVSYGGKAGRVDATSWWIIGAGMYHRLAPDRAAAAERARRWWPQLWRAAELLEAWQINGRGLVYVPLAGNWADEYPLSGYLLYDQLLALWASRELALVADALGHGDAACDLAERAAQRAALIDASMWPREGATRYDDKVLGRAVDPQRRHYLAGFDPAQPIETFDALGNALALLLGLPDAERAARIRDHASALLDHDLVPAFDPRIGRADPRWPLLEGLAAGALRNEPGHYHNGGLWPMIGGFWALAAAVVADAALARTFARGVTAANAQGFPEYLVARSGEAGGVRGQAWSAAAQLLAEAALHRADLQQTLWNRSALVRLRP